LLFHRIALESGKHAPGSAVRVNGHGSDRGWRHLFPPSVFPVFGL